MPTVAELRSILERYAGQKNDWLSRLNLVRARMIQQDWAGTTQQIVLSIYTDAAGNNIVTLPRSFVSLRAGAVSSTSSLCGGLPLSVRNPWSEFNANGSGYNATTGFQEVAGAFSVFAEWTSASKIRFKPAVAEGAGNIVITGTLAGADQSETVALNGANNVTSVAKFDAYRFKIVKPSTTGKISAYAVVDDGTETLIAVYDTTETLVRWKRYKVPYCSPPSGYSYIALAKLAYVPVVADSDEVIPGNIGALQHGLDALLAEDSRNGSEADALWERAKKLLVEEAENETGAGAENVVEISDDLDIACLGHAL